MGAVVSVVVPNLLGFISAGSVDVNSRNRFRGSPPSWLFPPVWTILYSTMGYSSYLIYRSEGQKSRALSLYALQLALNYSWSPVFWSGRHGSALVIISLMGAMIAATIYEFHKINPKAAYLLCPYLLWVSYATYLNAGIYHLNRKAN
eukprot:TRINITY_DN8351_c0_g1_i1.p1 TRINITY_DN8351_c0_g1~~TRINITY_DN8351_c0_g1_i1.p1  ORF type:complete len:162 (-),score=4.96 TRINITY_DN8351_c0_g1_i1:31-471(-)